MAGESVANLTVGAPEPAEVSDNPIAEEPLEDEQPVIIAATETQVRRLLQAGGNGMSALFADEAVPGLWQFTSDELDLLTPPLTSIINRRPRLQQAVMRGDEATVLATLGAYMWRNVSDLQAARAAQQPEEPADAPVQPQP